MSKPFKFKKPFKKNNKKSDNPFWSAIQDIRKLNYEGLDKRQKQIHDQATSNQPEKGQKMPVKMLVGIRKKTITKFSEQQKNMRESNVQYDSSAQNFDLAWHYKKMAKNERRKKKHEYNSYKFKDTKQKAKFGNFKGGMLTLSNKDATKLK